MDLPFDAPFTFAMAREAALSRGTLRRFVRDGLVRRAVSGVYVPTTLPDDVSTRAAALRLMTPDDCVVVDRHAGWVLGAQMVLAPGEHLGLRPLSLFRPSGHGRLRNDLTHSGERNLTDDDVMTLHGLRVTTPLRTALDLGRVRRPDEAICGLDAMFRLGGFTRDEFLSEIERFRGMRWVVVLRAIGPLADARSESPGESILRLRCIENGLGGMVPQVEVWRGEVFVARLDLADESLMTAVEYDGVEWHTSPAQREHDHARRTEAREEGWDVHALTGANLFGHHRDVELLLARIRLDAEARRRRPA